jgi:hypothetical protein
MKNLEGCLVSQKEICMDEFEIDDIMKESWIIY